MGGQTGLRPLRRRLLAGMGALGASACAPWILRAARAASAPGNDPSPDGGAARPEASRSDEQPLAVLYEEDSHDQMGTRYPGLALWTLVEKADDRSEMREPLVRASVAIPDRQMVMTFTLRRNDDKSLPASHVVDFTFTLPPDAPRRIGNVPGVLMKPNEQARGVPLKGVSVKVTDGCYLIGLSAGNEEQAANMALLEADEWFDVPIVYDDGHRAILAFQKGEPGRHVFAQARAAWNAAAHAAPPQQAPSPSLQPPQKLPLPPDIIK